MSQYVLGDSLETLGHARIPNSFPQYQQKQIFAQANIRQQLILKYQYKQYVVGTSMRGQCR